MGGSSGRRKLKVKSTKGKLWKKGHSSDSNPATRKHRDAAKNKYFSINKGPSDLTVGALAKHDANSATLPGQDEATSMDTQTVASVGGKTFNTWATNWTDCTNATFSKVHRYWASNSAMHKEVLAILAAITEVIKEQGGKGSETEYFAILNTALDKAEDETMVAATLYLLSLSIKRTRDAVLRNKFSETAKKVLKTLGNFADSEAPLLVKSALQCIAGLLRAQGQAAWSSAYTMEVYRAVLAYTIHSKPRVRKCAQHAVRVVLKTPTFLLDETTTHHPAAATTATFCIHHIEQHIKSGADATTTLHLLGLMQHLLSTFPQNSLQSACEIVLRTMALSNVVVTSVALKTLHGLFISKPNVENLPPPLNARIISALYDFQPGEQDTQPMAAWLRVMEAAHSNLAKHDEELGLRHLPRLLKSCMKCLLRDDNIKAAASTLTAVITNCLPEMRSRLAALATSPSKTSLHEIVQHLEGGLSYQYHGAWDAVLNTIAAFFKTVGKEVAHLCGKLLLSMCDLRDSPNFPYRGEVDQAVGAAVKSMGPKAVLHAVPLQISGEEDNYDFPRSWIVPVIRDNVTHTELAFFVSYFLPLVTTLRKKSLEYEFGGRTVEAKSYDALQNQIWSMLPGFCTHPTDLPESFKGIAKVLGEALYHRADLRFTLLSSLRKLVQHSLEDDASRVVMSRFAKNYIPILFNLYTAKPEGDRDPKRMAVLETAKVFFQITDEKLIRTLFVECVTKMSADDAEAFRTHALMDLVILLLPYVELSLLQKLYPIVISSLTDSDKTIEKKSYRVLEEICCGSSAACQALVASKLPELQQHLAASISSSTPSARAPRLRCLSHILKQLEVGTDSSMEFVRALVPEAVLCTREVATKARKAAFELLSDVGTTLERWHGGDMAAVQRELFEMLLAGLGGKPHMVSCTVLALTKVILDIKESLETANIKLLVDATCLLLRSKAREIVTATVGLLKVLISVTSESNLASSLPDIVGSLVSMKDDNKHHLRFRNKEIYTRLIRKFGYEVILKLVPESHHRILINIRKTMARNERKKNEDKEEDSDDDDGEKMGKAKPETIDELLQDSDSELEEEEEKEKPKTKGKKKKAAWIKEDDDEGMIVDFLDPAVNKKVLATKPSSESSAANKGIKHDFKTASDGRLVITEFGDEEEDNDVGNKKRKADADDDDDMDEGFSYKPGGSGIHRPLKRKVEEDVGQEYRAKKAKGDVKKKNKVDPYAYIPLNISSLNRRKQKKGAGTFANMVKAAKKGAQTGSKKGKKMRK